MDEYVGLQHVGSLRILYCKLDLPSPSQLRWFHKCTCILQISIDLFEGSNFALHRGEGLGKGMHEIKVGVPKGINPSLEPQDLIRVCALKLPCLIPSGAFTSSIGWSGF